MAMVNKVHIQAWIPLQLAPYIVTHNHPYISSCSRYQQARLAATYVGIVMCDNVGCYSCNGIHACICTLFTTAIRTSF